MSKIREEIENQKETVENGLKKILCSVNDDSNNGVLVLRIAATLLDTDGKFVFLRANMDDGDLGTDAANEGKIERAATEMQEQLTKDGASSITSYLIDAGVSCPFWLSYSGDTINTYVLTPNKEEVHISDEGRAVQVGFELNSKFLEACRSGCNVAIHLAFYPLNYTLSDSFFPAFALFVVESREDVARTFVEKTLPKVRECLAPIVILESMMRIEAANRHALKSAIGSIMSRNGSHNIGSHVLAALSHNVGTMPDDRVLYQYIQYRMDYIATVTTDMPKWRHPMQFVGDIMKHFLTQRHLLDYIAGSEGLKAWQFQNPNANNSHCLKFHVRRMETRLVDVNGAEVHKRVLVHDFLKYPESGPIDLTYDVPLAIPGGIVGQHALFTIFENIVRNAAKHDWAVQHPLSEKNNDQSDDNLDVYIEFEDKPESGVVEFIIYTSKSDATTEVETPGKKLWQRQNERINTPLINDQGELRRENWGLAEMKISAGYLQSREMTEIGGLDATDEKVLKDRERFGPIIEVVPVDKDGTDEDKLQLKGRLGYKFKVPKPKTFLLLVESEKVVPEGEQAVKLMAAGIYVRARSKIKPTDDDMSAEFVIMSSFDKECLQWRLPFRIITTNPGSNLDIVKDQLASWSNSLTDDAKFDSVDAIVQALCCGALTPEMLAKRVAVCWTDYMIGRRLDLSGKLNLIVAPTLNKVGDDEELKSRLLRVGSEGNVQGSGKSLINPASAVTYVFEEGFDRAVGSFVKLYKLDVLDGGPEEDEKKSTYAALKAMCDMRPRRIESEIRKSDAGYETLVPLQLKAWMAALKCSGDVLCYLETRCASGDDAELSDVIRQIAELKKSMPTKYSDDPRWRDLVRRSNRISSRRRQAARDAKHFFSHFVDYLIEVCKQAKGYLGKYAENISSLPAGYEIKSDGGTVTGKAEHLKPEGAQASDWEFGRLHVYTKCVDCKQQPVVLYVRHLNQNDGVNRSDADNAPPPFVESPFAAFAGAVHYAESLSGTQSYLNQLMRLSVEKSIIQAKLVENALMRLLILDERMSRFVREHADSILATFARMSVTIADERSVGIEGEMDASDSKGKNSEEDSECALRYTTQGLLDINPAHVRALRDLVMLSKDRDSFEDGFKQAETGVDLYRSKFDILVIHQGIIDKWFPAVAHDPKKMPLLLYGLRRVFPYVVITTGRGTPANVPEMARVLPFPTVATTMFKKYPEKLVLVDAIMNLLPIRKR